jgi:hypothetical protein
MQKVVDRETIIARLIFNTRRIKRPNSLLEIARDIRWLEKNLGSMKGVSNAINISTEMLRRFLSVEELCPEVRKLVHERKIDSLNIVLYMRNFDPNSQITIANEVIQGKLTGDDIRVLAPFHKNNPDMPIDKLIARVQKSKDIRVFIAYFRIPEILKNKAETLKRKFERLVGKSGIISLKIRDRVGILTLSSDGHKKLREVVSKSKLNLRQFVDDLIAREIKGINKNDDL